MNKKLVLMSVLVHCSIILLLTSCWDQMNIEDRAFVTGIAIDRPDETINDQISLTQQFIIPSKLGGIEKNAGESNTYTNLSVSGNTMFGLDQKISAITARQPYYEHAKIIIVSDVLAKEPGVFGRLMDSLIRSSEMRRSTRVFIAGEKASDILEIQPETDKSPAMYIDSLVDSNDVNLTLTEPKKIGDLHANILQDDGYTISHIVPIGSKRVESNGVNVFSGTTNQIVGHLNDEETKGLNLITRTNKGGYINFSIENHLMVYAIEKTSRTIKIDVSNPNNIEIDVHIIARGKIGETFSSKSLLQEDYIEKIVDQINKRIEQLATNTIKKAQEELQVDFLKFSTKLRKNHYAVWKQIKDNWDRGDHLFSKSNITVSVNAEIFEIGSVDRAKDKGNE